MNKANLKSYAPKARLDFIAAITARANLLGISAGGTLPAEARGDVVIIDGREWPAKLLAQRDELIARIKRRGFEQTMDEVAYTWFNRFAALRFMEIHEYLDHGWRVLSSRNGGLPEILRHASEVSLPGLNAVRAREMQLAGDRDNELYRLLLIAQCNELSRAMPFLFEHIDDETELLLPENLLRTDSIIAKLIAAVPEEDWHQIEVIGWLYQFYISEKKDEVIGKVVKSEDIPAATQLFTPNWIVQYLVQNSVGRLWLMANPTSTLASQWSYYIPPAEQSSEVQAELDTLIRTRIREDGEALNPENLTVLDPACGSGHILVAAYDLLKDIYLERGYQPRAIPRLILEMNLWGLDIDDRAAQLAGFALMMKAVADDRRLLNDPPKLNLLALRESKDSDANEMGNHLAPFGIPLVLIKALLNSFERAKSVGSLIQIPAMLKTELTTLARGLQGALRDGDLYAKQAARDLLPLVKQAIVLATQFDVVVANPPYMGSRYYNSKIKSYVESHYEHSKGDLYACFMARNSVFCRLGGVVGMITIPNWMFLSTFEELRLWLLATSSIETFVHNGRGVFGSDFGSCAFTFRNLALPSFKGRYKRLFSKQGSVSGNEELEERFHNSGYFEAMTSDFAKIPGGLIAYWISSRAAKAFESKLLKEYADIRSGIGTSNNERFLRFWWEVDHDNCDFGCRSLEDAQHSTKRWFPYNKGGSFRKWFGNREYLVNWKNDGADIKAAVVSNPDDPNTTHWSRRIFNTDLFFLPSLTWNDVGVAGFSVRDSDAGFIHDAVGVGAYKIENAKQRCAILALLNSRISTHYMEVLCPTVHFKAGQVGNFPVIFADQFDATSVAECVDIARLDWNSHESSWDFEGLRILAARAESLKSAWEDWQTDTQSKFNRMQTIETQNNRIFIEAYRLNGELLPDVPDNQITLTGADREKDIQCLISYAIGCMMGRYSLDEPGLVYAHASNVEFDAGRYVKFLSDADGIVPVTGERWFDDDAAVRVREFLRVVWGTEGLEDNTAWLADSLGPKGRETPDDTLRRYLADRFYKDHLLTYKRRPIYWLFSSGKQGAFQALVYLHRYHEGTLARLRAEYVAPLIAKVIARLEMLERDAAAALSAGARSKIQKQIESMRKKQVELLAYDEKLRHYADMRIALNLDDGVKVNYAKFGDLVAESKAITGKSDD